MRWLLVVMLLAGVARAEDQPWAAGVTAAQKASAKTLLDAGNTLFLEKRYADALEQYRRAVGVWDHPAIRFNMVRCLIQLDHNVEAAENLALALKYGAAPLEEAVYAEALAYGKLLAKQVGDVEIRCTQAGVTITFDGKPVGTCPGATEQHASPGAHQLVGTRPGFLPKTTEVMVLGGERAQVEVSLIPLEKAAHIEHRWAAWIPWVVFGGGVAVAAMGGVLEVSASNRYSAYDDHLRTTCPTGCALDDPRVATLTDEKRSAQRLDRVAVGVLAVGAAAAITGGVLFYLNRGRTVYPEVAPLPGGGTLGIRARW